MERDSVKTIWRKNWAEPFFKRRLIQAMILWIVVLIAFPIFFNYIETREGTTLNDRLLAYLPRYNVSVPTFLIVYKTKIVGQISSSITSDILKYLLTLQLK